MASLIITCGPVLVPLAPQGPIWRCYSNESLKENSLRNVGVQLMLDLGLSLGPLLPLVLLWILLQALMPLLLWISMSPCLVLLLTLALKSLLALLVAPLLVRGLIQSINPLVMRRALIDVFK